MLVFKIVLDLFVLALIYQFVFYKKWKNDQLALKSILYLYFCGVILVTLMPVVANLPFIFSHSYAGMSMVPFEDMFMARGDYMRQIILNIVMMVPFGILYPLIYKKSCINVIGKAFLISLFIEVIQPLISGARSSDITDIINNVFGAFVGFMIYKALSPVLVKMQGYLD